MSSPYLSIVIPVYNEEESVSLLCEKLNADLPLIGRTYEVLLIDDGSTDRTWARLLEQSARFPNFRLISFRRNFGQTAAISAGFHHSRGSVIITLDADLQNDPSDIPLLLSKIDEGYDVVSGFRKERKDAFMSRTLPSRLANRLISRSTGVKLRDYGCTLKAYRREIIRDVHLYGELHRYIPALAACVGARVTEVPVNHRARQFGHTKYDGLARTPRVILDLLTVILLRKFITRPGQLIGGVGLIFLTIAMGMVVAIILDRWVFNHGLNYVYYHKRSFWVVTPVMLAGFGLQFIVTGLLAELQTRTYHELQNKRIYRIREMIGFPQEAQ